MLAKCFDAMLGNAEGVRARSIDELHDCEIA